MFEDNRKIVIEPLMFVTTKNQCVEKGKGLRLGWNQCVAFNVTTKNQTLINVLAFAKYQNQS